MVNDVVTVLKNAKKRPLIVTEEGKPSVYVLSVEIFDRLFSQLLEQDESLLNTNVREGELQFSKGNFMTLEAALAAAEAKWQKQGLSRVSSISSRGQS